jgi:quinol monooxygenase YgiN
MPVDEAFRPLSAWEAVSLSQETGRRGIPGYPAEGLGDPAEGLGDPAEALGVVPSATSVPPDPGIRRRRRINMAYVVTAIWKAKKGQEDKIAEMIGKMTPPSRKEPACLVYQAHRSLEDPTVFFLYEQYVDAAGYEAHMASPHFEQYVKSEAIPNLESRERAFYETMDFS